jgi:hypothetical protein
VPEKGEEEIVVPRFDGSVTLAYLQFLDTTSPESQEEEEKGIIMHVYSTLK